MKLRTVMLLKALICISFGVPMLLIPAKLMALYGLTLDDSGMVMARLYGAALLGNLLLTWFARDDSGSTALNAIVLHLLIYDGIGFIVTLFATLTGVMSAFGWTAVGIYLFFTVGFGYYEFAKHSVILKHQH